MDNDANNFIIHQGVDEENYYLLWPVSEWIWAVFVVGFLVSFHHVLLGLLAAFLLLYFFQRTRTEERGSKAHLFWRLGLWQGQKALPWAPNAHATRFDN